MCGLVLSLGAPAPYRRFQRSNGANLVDLPNRIPAARAGLAQGKQGAARLRFLCGTSVSWQT